MLLTKVPHPTKNCDEMKPNPSHVSAKNSQISNLIQSPNTVTKHRKGNYKRGFVRMGNISEEVGESGGFLLEELTEQEVRRRGRR